SAVDDHAWGGATRPHHIEARCDLLWAISVNKQSARSHDVVSATATKIGFIDSDEHTNTLLLRVHGQDFGPTCIERAVEDFGVFRLAIAKKLEGETRGVRIKRGEEL